MIGFHHDLLKNGVKFQYFLRWYSEMQTFFKVFMVEILLNNGEIYILKNNDRNIVWEISHICHTLTKEFSDVSEEETEIF